MNSLEFIENFIKNLEEEIENLKKKIEANEKYYFLMEYHFLKQRYELELKASLQGLEKFYQIKTELEAWEIVKKNIVIDTTGSLYTIQIYKQDEECKTFEKALEVENES